jgi:hypothetical protein
MANTDGSFEELNNLTFALIGREYTTDATSSQFKRLVSLYNTSLNEIYRASNYWERYLVVGEERTVSNGSFNSTENSKETIDTLLRVHKTAPFGTSTATELDVYAKGNAYHIIGTQPSDNKVYATFKKAHGLSFGAGDSDSKAVPREFLSYIAHKTAYTWQRSVEQNASENNFGLSLAVVRNILEDELAKLDDQNVFNTIGKKFKNYRNTQTIL